MRTLVDYYGTTWRVTEEDLLEVGLRAGDAATVFSAEGQGRRWVKGIPSTLRPLAIDELWLMLERAKFP